jgi:hypothetical protein
MSTAQSAAEQLELLQPPAVAAALRLDERTRRVGLAGVARARLALAQARDQRLRREAEVAESRRPGQAA